MKRRKTSSQKEILELLKSSESALNHEMIKKNVSDSIDRATIYRILNRFCEDKIVHKIVGDDGKQYFAFCINCESKKHNHNHFHFRCVGCGKVECLEKEVKVSLPSDYTMHNFNGVISGFCSNCS
ncbi:Fur family transcriptional regulator [Aquimarina sediminis]|uniref:Fur family transcriptional regulator n=1 Tax=Aquimarina sediminis TaxID=2070536 RepID=UPI000CA059CF|nr:transcriptional repressor [Aquimarina sediminis]